MRRLQFSTITINIPWVGLTLKLDDDKKIAKSTINELESHRILFLNGENLESGSEALSSANKIRSYLNEKISAASNGELETSLKRMRAACMEFANASGQDGKNFRSTSAYIVALGVLRGRIGDEVATLKVKYKLTVDDTLTNILPQSDN
jgi:hypothetical protein